MHARMLATFSHKQCPKIRKHLVDACSFGMGFVHSGGQVEAQPKITHP